LSHTVGQNRVTMGFSVVSLAGHTNIFLVGNVLQVLCTGIDLYCSKCYLESFDHHFQSGNAGAQPLQCGISKLTTEKTSLKFWGYSPLRSLEVDIWTRESRLAISGKLHCRPNLTELR